MQPAPKVFLPIMYNPGRGIGRTYGPGSDVAGDQTSPAPYKRLKDFMDVDAKEVLLYAAAGTVAVVVARGLGAGNPDGVLGLLREELPRQFLVLGGPLALGVLGANYIGAYTDADKKSPMSFVYGNVLASAFAVAGLMATNTLVPSVDVATLTTVATAAAGMLAVQILL